MLQFFDENLLHGIVYDTGNSIQTNTFQLIQPWKFSQLKNLHKTFLVSEIKEIYRYCFST